MKIKMTKKMRLDELIKYIFDNDEANRVFIDDGEDFAVHTTSSDADVNIEHLKGYGGKKCISKKDTFTVEVEEELTNRTKLPDLVIVYNDNFIITDSDECISEYINDYDNESVSNRMYAPYKGGLKLVWSRKNGIPEHGVLEVGAE